MKPMTWYPDNKDKEINQYLDKINHAPYPTIFAGIAVLFCLFTILILVGGF